MSDPREGGPGLSGLPDIDRYRYLHCLALDLASTARRYAATGAPTYYDDTDRERWIEAHRDALARARHNRIMWRLCEAIARAERAIAANRELLARIDEAAA